MARRLQALAVLTTLLFGGCSSPTTPAPSTNHNAFAEGEQVAEDGKNDTGFVTNLNAAEVEFDIEGELDARYWDAEAPLQIGQFALTYLRTHNDVYIQSLAEDYAHGSESIEWKIGDDWVPSNDPRVEEERPTRFRLAAVSGIIVNPGTRAQLAGREYHPVVPTNPGRLFRDVGDNCGEGHGDIDVSQDVYWYVWDPEKRGCDAVTQELDITVARLLPVARAVYPEYDRLLEDGTITAAVLFGQVEHGTLSDHDLAFWEIDEFKATIVSAGFEEAEAEIGWRYTRTQGGVEAVIDVLGPREFAGLDDTRHARNFDNAVNEHEIIVWNGHSMLGASDFWARPSIYNEESADTYQIFLYNGCLGYEYYVNPILTGKGGWENVDIVSNALETPFAITVPVTASVLGAIMGSAERGGSTSWKRILGAANRIGGSDAIYGASGVRDNAFHPNR